MSKKKDANKIMPSSIPSFISKESLEMMKLLVDAENIVLKKRSKSLESKNNSVTHTRDYSQVVWKGIAFYFSERQAKIIKMMWERRDEGELSVTTADVLKFIDSSNRNKSLPVKDIFNGHPAWNKFIRPVKKKLGRYELVFPKSK